MLATGLALVAGAATFGFSSAEAQVTTIEVTTSDDGAVGEAGVVCPAASGDGCTLRAAVAFAASDVDVDTIVFAAGVNPQLSDDAGLGQIQIAGELTILGNVTGGGGPGTTISGGEPGEDDYEGRLIDTEAGADLTLENLVLTGGKIEASNARGGAVQSLGALTIVNSRFQDNLLDGNLVSGGAIFSQGSLTVRNSEFVDNRAVGASGGGNPTGSGGAIAAHDNASTIEGTSFQGNEASRVGGAVQVVGASSTATVQVRDSTFGGSSSEDGNTANTGGAFSIGIDSGSASGEISRSIFEGNEASNVGGAIYNDRSELLVRESTIRENEASAGGGLYVFALGAELTLDRSLVAANRATDGAGIFSDTGAVTVRNSTISANQASAFGGAFYGNSATAVPVAFVHATVVGNSADGFSPAGGGLIVAGSDEVTFDHSIIAGNVDGDCVTVPNAITSLGHNIDSDETCVSDPTDQTVADVMLGDLANNGGPTLTHLPLEGSPAIDGGLNPTCVVDVDQRGEPRPGANSSACDIGAVEVQVPGEEPPPGEVPPGEEPPSGDEPDDTDDDDELEEISETAPAEPVVAQPDFTG